MRVVIWNVWYRASFRAILQTLRELDADVLMLQELTTTSKFNPSVDMPSEIRRRLAMDGASIPVRVIRNRKGDVVHEECLAIFTRHAIKHACHPVLRSGGTLKGARAESYRRFLQVQVGNRLLAATATVNTSGAIESDFSYLRLTALSFNTR